MQIGNLGTKRKDLCTESDDSQFGGREYNREKNKSWAGEGEDEYEIPIEIK